MTDDIGSLREHGRVNYWNAAKSFGFIRSDFPGPDLFVHVSELKTPAPLKFGDRVSFLPAPDKRNPAKMRATAVELSNGA